MEYEPQAQSKWAASMTGIPGSDNSFLQDLFTSQKEVPDKPITCGFYRQKSGEPLVYTYTYEEMKVVLEGEFHIQDQTGRKVIGKPGDVFHFHNGDTITFSSPDYALAFFCGQKEMGHV